jgi:hypothetical protein
MALVRNMPPASRMKLERHDRLHDTKTGSGLRRHPLKSRLSRIVATRSKAVGYGRRSLVETGMQRYKTIIGRTLRARTLSGQKVEARVGCKVLNRITALGMPVSRRLA